MTAGTIRAAHRSGGRPLPVLPLGGSGVGTSAPAPAGGSPAIPLAEMPAGVALAMLSWRRLRRLVSRLPSGIILSSPVPPG